MTMDYVRIGERLKLVRKQKGLSYDQIFEVTRIQPVILKGIELGQTPVSPVFLRGFIKTYSRSLGLDPDDLLEWSESTKSETKDKIKKKTEIFQTERVKRKRIYSRFLFISFGIFILTQVFIFTDVKEKYPVGHLKDTPPVKDTYIQSQPDDFASHSNNMKEENQNFVSKDIYILNQIGSNVFKKEVFIQSFEPAEFYFKLDDQAMVTRTIQPGKAFQIKARQSIYLRIDQQTENIKLFYNGKQIEIENKDFFEKTFL